MRIKTGIADFDKLVANKLIASTNSNDFKAAIRNAQKYYQGEYAAVEPTIIALEICKSVKALAKVIESKKRKPSRELLLEMATMLGKLEAIKHPTPMAANERERTATDMQRRADQCLSILSKEAVANFAEAWDITSSRELMTTLAACAKVKSGYDKAQGALITSLNEKAAGFAQALPQAAREIFQYDGKVTLVFDPYKKKLRKMRAINAALEDIRERTYGPGANDYAAQLRKQRARGR